MSERPLWAPWRIEYITGPKRQECVFCHPDAESVLDRGERCFSILNTYPYAPGHVMIAPHRHVGGLDELEEQELLELMRLAQRTITATKRAMSPDGFNVGLNLGAVAGAGIADHLHLHVVPRWQGDNSFMPVLADTRVIPQALQATREALLEALAHER
jgi:ATP adenylyltransferase